MNKRAFSLIELLVVIAIIAIIAAIAIPSYSKYKIRATFGSYESIIYGAQQSLKSLIRYASSNSPSGNLLPLASNGALYRSTVGWPASWGNNPTSAANYAIPPYLAKIFSGGQYDGDGITCPNLAPQIFFSNFQGDYYSNNANPLLGVSFWVLLDKKGIWHTGCDFYDANGTFGASNPNIIPWCTYTSNPGTTPTLDNQYYTLSGCP